ncbi:hypothetical protein C1631_005715 [Chryseobacterium phosphatilyticum]|uniref:Uncharacterized protein n=1 Tax=Chryseobacterium phosphatilyticum TaxID=475075 RepID=A0A316XE50_9FLAO|nr:hypothetical protein C1631_005715 [Chryseobacterium phosphatilyticum]
MNSLLRKSADLYSPFQKQFYKRFEAEQRGMPKVLNNERKEVNTLVFYSPDCQLNAIVQQGTNNHSLI